MSASQYVTTLASRDLYAELMVSSDAPAAVINSAHRALIKSVHPDASGADTGERAALLNEARDVLTDPLTRAEYDRARKLFLCDRVSDPSTTPPPTQPAQQTSYVPTQFYTPPARTHTFTPPRPQYHWTALTWFFATFAAVMLAFAATGLSVLAGVDAVVNSRRGELGSLVDAQVWHDSDVALFAFAASLATAVASSFLGPRLKLSAGRSLGVCLVVFFTTLGFLGLGVGAAPAAVFFTAAALTAAATAFLRLRRLT